MKTLKQQAFGGAVNTAMVATLLLGSPLWVAIVSVAYAIISVVVALGFLLIYSARESVYQGLKQKGEGYTQINNSTWCTIQGIVTGAIVVLSLVSVGSPVCAFLYFVGWGLFFQYSRKFENFMKGKEKLHGNPDKP